MDSKPFSYEWTVLLAIVSIWFLSVLTSRLRLPTRCLPTAPRSEASFLWGHQLRVFKGEVVAEYLRWTLNIAPVYRIKAALFRPDIVVIADNLAARHIFQDAYNYVKDPAFLPIIEKLLGRGIVWAEGDEHKHLRKVVVHAFSAGAVRNMSDDVWKCVDKCVQRIVSDIERSGSNSAVLNMPMYLEACTFEAIASIGFGQAYAYDSPESLTITESWLSDVQQFSTFAYGFLPPLILSIFPWVSSLPIPALQQDSVAKRTVQNIGKKLLEQNEVNRAGTDLFSLLVKDSSLSHQELLDNIVTFLIAGHETTSNVLVFTLYALSKDLDAQAALRAELQHISLGDYTVLDKLPYLDAVTREGLRLFPIPHDTERVVTRDDVIPLQTPIKMLDGKLAQSFHVKAGQRFVIPFTVLNVNPATWGPDAAEFNPERWLVPGGLPSAGLPHGPFANVTTFADGPRNCIGWRLAVMELKIILSVLIKSFEFKDTGAVVEKRFAPALNPFVDGKAGQLPLHVSMVH
ncbi:cytochrome P450 [Hymenopellis radicata]|nr:cytochrome P450 [Hymenopellis radicata]